MNCISLFALKLPFLTTEYEPLKAIRVHKFYNTDIKKWVWIFSIAVLDDVIRILGKPVEFNKDSILKMQKYSPMLAQNIDNPARKKGIGFFNVVEWEDPDLFVIETVIDKKVTRIEVPKIAVRCAWDVMKQYPKGKEVKSSTVAGNILKKIGIDYFDVEVDTKDGREEYKFDWKRFLGSRTEYFRYYYYVLKTLQGEGLINHGSKSVSRIKDTWDNQAKFRVEN